MKPDTNKLFRSARRAGTPLIGITTFDPAATMAGLKATTPETSPIVAWDICRGLYAVNKAGTEALGKLEVDPAALLNPTEMLVAAVNLPDKTILFMLQAHRCLDNSKETAPVSQAIWNLRDLFKGNHRTLVLLGPTFNLPAEIAQDVLLLDEPLPGEDELRNIITTTVSEAKLTIKPAELAKAVDAGRGLAAFPFEQITSMSLSESGLDIDGLWDRKRTMIESTAGLSVWRGGERFSDIGGVENAKQFLKMVVAGKDAPRVIVFIDEIEKMFAGATGGTADSSGVSQGFLGTMLSYMQDEEASGTIFVGPPGAAKSALAKATGAEAQIPTIALDLSGMKASLVGESEGRLRNALKVITAVGGGRAMFIATCNRIASLPPELRRRFTMGTFFFDLPTTEERAVIWQIYKAKYKLSPAQTKDAGKLDDNGWTGAEIKQCCLLAYRLNCTLAAASKFVVPVAKSAAEEIQSLRRQATGKFLSASQAGLYTFEETATAASGSRALTKDEV